MCDNQFYSFKLTILYLGTDVGPQEPCTLWGTLSLLTSMFTLYQNAIFFTIKSRHWEKRSKMGA